MKDNDSVKLRYPHKLPIDKYNGLTYLLLRYVTVPAIDFFRNIGMTPNQLTLISFIAGLLSIYYLYYFNILWYGVFLSIAVIFDYFDGAMARKYSMQTQFGDKFDHYTDMITYIGIFVVLMIKYKLYRYPLILIFGILYFLIVTIELGCTEVYINDSTVNKSIKPSIFMEPLKKLCPNIKIMDHISLVDHGSSTIVMIIMPLLCLMYSKHNK